MIAKRWTASNGEVKSVPYLPMKGGKPLLKMVDSGGKRTFYGPYSVENQAVRDYVHKEYYENGFWSGDGETKIEDYHLGVRPFAPLYEGDDEHRNAFYPGWTGQGRPILFILTNYGSGKTLKIVNNGRTREIANPDKYCWVYNLVPGAATYNVVTTGTDTSLESGSIEVTGQLRMLSLKHVGNVRDIGGWPVVDKNNVQTGMLKYNRMLRGSKIDTDSSYIASDYECEVNIKDDLDTMVDDIGITMHVDLQTADGHTTYLPSSVENHVQTNTIGSYASFFTTYKTELKNIFGWYAAHLASNASNCVYTNCYSGKDRTGCVMAAIEAMCGCEEDTIIKDWELTSFWALGSNMTISPRKSGTTPKRLYAWFNALKSFSGSTYGEKIETFLKSIGVTTTQIANIKNGLVKTYGAIASTGTVTCNENDYGEYVVGGERRSSRRCLAVNHSTGKVVYSGIDLCCTCYLPVTAGGTITMSAVKRGSVLAYYNSSKSYLSGVSASADAVNKTFTVPAGAAYVVVNYGYDIPVTITVS